MDKRIVNSWSFCAFTKGFVKAQMGSFKSPKDGEPFKSLIFTDSEGHRTFVGFSSHLGELSGSQLKSMKADLQVVELDSGNLYLCKQGQGSWEDLDIL